MNTAAVRYRALPWIRNPGFDVLFIFGLPVMAAMTGLVVSLEPRLLVPIVTIDLWLLGFHHVISTYTRLCFDRESFRQNYRLVVYLLPAVALVTLAVALTFGAWVVVTVYFYWQWWHYTRQSWGLSRAFRGKDRGALYEDGWLDRALFYGIPVLGILSRSSEHHTRFLWLEFWSLPVPTWFATVAGWGAIACFVLWLALRFEAARAGRLAVVHSLYMLSHFAMFALGYLVTSDITIGWLIVNMWHNSQYILFVWMFNNRRFSGGPDPNARFLSYISQDGRIVLYLLACLGLAGILYGVILQNLGGYFFTGLIASVVIYQVINFHHYIVDSLIWKMRSAHVQKNVGV